MKTTFKNALAISKRALPKKDGRVRLVGQGKELLLFTEGQGLMVYDYIPLEEETVNFAIEIDPAPLDKWLDGGNRELVFEIREQTKKNKTSYVLYSIEKNKSIAIEKCIGNKKSFLEVRDRPYKDFNNQDLIIQSWYEANSTFQNSDRTYSNYAKVTDRNFMVFSPLFFSAYFYQEDFGILREFGVDGKEMGLEGIAIPKEAIDTFVKTVKKPKRLQHFLSTKCFLIREGNTIFAMHYSEDVKFPGIKDIKVINDQKYPFIIDADEVNKGLKTFPNSKVNKLRFIFKDTSLIIQADNIEYEDIQISCKHSLNISCAFTPSAIKALFEGLKGEVEITHTIFKSKTTKEGYYWKFHDNNESKIIPGIKEASGF